MTDDLSAFWIHSVTVERFTGVAAYGDTYATATTETGLVDDGQRLIVGPDGEQITSTARVFLPTATATVPLQSRITLPAAFGDRITEVVSVAHRDGGGLPLPDHIELALL